MQTRLRTYAAGWIVLAREVYPSSRLMAGGCFLAAAALLGASCASVVVETRDH